MIIVKGEDYETDYNRPAFKKSFESMEELYAFLTKDLPYGKETLELPWLDKEGNIKVPRSMSAAIRFKIADRRYPVTECIFQIEENGKILFSDGSLTDGRAQIGSRVRELLVSLERFKKADYDFAD